MSVTRAERAAQSTGTTVGGVWPQVNLLPPEVGVSRKLKSTKRMLGYAVLGVVVVVAAGSGVAVVTAAAASAELARAQDDNAVLLAEQATYAEVPRVLGQISTAEGSRAAGMSTEIVWKPYLEALRAVTPAGVSYDTIGVNAATPVTAAPAPANVLATPGVGELVFTARSLVLPDMAAWMDAVDAIPHLSDPWFTSATLTDEEGAVYYQVSASVVIETSALALQYVPGEGE